MRPGALSVGIVGCGVIAREYATTLDAANAVHLVACADAVPSRATKLAATLSELQALPVSELLADPQVDLVVNLTTPLSHHGVNMAAITAGKHVYSEKPMGVDRDEAAELIAAAATAGVRIGSAPDTFMSLAVHSAQQLIAGGGIGEPIGGMLTFASAGHESWHPRPEFYYQRGGGPVFDMGPYGLTALVSLLGPVATVSAAALRPACRRVFRNGPAVGREIPVDTDTHVTSLLELELGAKVSCLFSFDVGASRLPKFELYGSEGTLSLSDPADFGATLEMSSGKSGQFQEIPLPSPGHEGRGVGVVDMAEAVLADTEHRASGRLALHVIDIMGSISEAAARGSRVSVANASSVVEVGVRS